MPELPEVENIVRDLKLLEGQKIIFNRLLNDVNFQTPFYNLKDRIIERVERYGKYIIIVFDRTALMIHLSMSGQLYLEKGDYEIPKHCMWLLQLDDGWQLRFVDIRHFGKCWHMSYDECKKYVQSKLGPEIWDITAESFILITKQPKYQNRMLKDLLLEQRYIAGIGNIYASEICYESFIDPHTLIKNLRDTQIEQIYYNIKKILDRAIKNGGTTLKDYRNGKGNKGNNQNFLKAYKQKECKKCNKPIQKSNIKGRSTFWCPSCQK